MKTVLLGKHITKNYVIDSKKKIITLMDGSHQEVFTNKPTIKLERIISTWEKICEYDGTPHYDNEGKAPCKYVHISEDTQVIIEKEIFRADENKMYQYTSKILSEVDSNKEECIKAYETIMKEFNKTMIESNETLKRYCDIHNLSYEKTDCLELFKLVFPRENYVIENGALKVQDINRIDTSVATILLNTKTNPCIVNG